jgi:hypothetical protein
MAHAHAAPNSVLLSEIQTESLQSATDEFITIVNNTASSVDLTGWRLAYVTASATTLDTPSRTIALSGMLLPNETATASTASVVGKQDTRWTFASTLSASGGHVLLQTKLANGSYETVDIVGWGSALLAETAPVEVVSAGKTYIRNKTDSLYTDTDNNKEDFTLPALVIESATSANASQQFVIITELLPDPVSPLTDANDEYVELFNPTSAPVSLGGAKIQTGNTYSYSYTFSGEVVPANGYLVLYASTTNLSLSNSGGRARLVDANGVVLYEVTAYSKAEAGKSWSLFGDAWEWSEPSPMAEATTAAVAGAQASAKTPASTKSTKSSKSASSTSGSAKTAKKDTSTPFAAYAAPPQDGAIAPVNPLILAGVGVFAVGYMVYEYKNDILFRIKQRHRNRILRKAARSKA